MTTAPNLTVDLPAGSDAPAAVHATAAGATQDQLEKIK